MSSVVMTMLPVSFQIAVLAVLLFLSVRLIRENGRQLIVVFLTFLFTMWLLTDLYWVIYDFMRPDSRMPFAVNEIGEATLFLLMPAISGTVVSCWALSAWKQAAGAVVFVACNVALWIAWSGEWVQDILIGAVFAYFLCSTACSLKVLRRLTGGEWIGLGLGCLLLILTQSLTFFTEPPLKSALDTGSYIFLTAGIVYWACKLLAAGRGQASPKAVLCHALALTAWTMTAKYMSDGSWYDVFLIVETFSHLFLYLSVRKVVAEA